MDAQRSLDNELPARGSADQDGFSLPGWIYRDADFLEVEKERIFAASWQIVCHLNDIPHAGDYHTLDFLGETVFVVRGQDGAPRGFFDECRHRAARLLDGNSG